MRIQAKISLFFYKECAYVTQKAFKKKPNPLKTAKVTEIDYKDVALLRKFISDRGKIRSRRITGVSVQEQRKIARAIKNAREMALLPYSTTGRPSRNSKSSK